MKKWSSKLIKQDELIRYHSHLSKKYGENVSRETIQWIAKERIRKQSPTADDIEKYAKELYDKEVVTLYKENISEKINRGMLYLVAIITIAIFLKVFGFWESIINGIR
jgi:hypothetical protein